jgi:hypothetical protein
MANFDNTIDVAAFIAPDRSVSVVISVETLSQSMTLDQYLTQDIALKRNNHANFRLVELNETRTLEDREGYTLLYNAIVDPLELLEAYDLERPERTTALPSINATILEFITIHDNSAYRIAYTNYLGTEDDPLLFARGRVAAAQDTAPAQNPLRPANNTGDGYSPGLAQSSTFDRESSRTGGAGRPDPGGSNPIGPDQTVPRDAGERFLRYMPIAQKMIDSFDLSEPNQVTVNNNSASTIANDSTPSPGGSTSPGIGPSKISEPTNNETDRASEDPFIIIKQRLARGDITLEEYEMLRETLES